jgi:mono/diheme cytochrome c family protein
VRRLALAAALLVAVAACAAQPGAAGPRAADRHNRPGARLFRAKCSACHVRPDRGRLAPAQWRPALDRHRDRLRLDATGWQDLGDYLAPPPDPVGRR